MHLLVTGSSYIRRLGYYINRQRNVSRLYAKNFNVDDVAIEETEILGYGGCTLPRLRKKFARRNSFPGIVVCQIGSNDLCDPRVNLYWLVDELVEFVESLLNRGASHVCVVELFPRLKTPYESYNDAIAEFNYCIQQAVEGMQNVEFTRLKRFIHIRLLPRRQGASSNKGSAAPLPCNKGSRHARFVGSSVKNTT